MKLDERNLPLSTDSAAAAGPVRPRRRALSEIPHRHDVAGRQRTRRRSRTSSWRTVSRAIFCSPPRTPPIGSRSRRHSPLPKPARPPPRSARNTMSPPSQPGRAASSTDHSPSGGRSSTRRPPTCSRGGSATPHGFATARHRRSSIRPTASRHAGRPICPAMTAANASGPSRTRKPATTPPPNARWIRRWSATAPITSRIMSRRT